ncbi:hypothetical protein GCM10023329_21270 [Streptomyces sanyensis]|uniref:Uncharacterized protein n=1 Tax=Streptomyces sanyensis TaxID=568869 RepID=A0ABP9A3B3_9ACTN
MYSCYFSYYVGRLSDEHDQILKVWHETHGSYRTKSQTCWRKIFYKLWHTSAVFQSASRANEGARSALDLFQLLGLCPICQRRASGMPGIGLVLADDDRGGGEDVEDRPIDGT